MSNEDWQLCALGELAKLDIERVPVLAGERYKVAGVLNAGRGLFEREQIGAESTNYPALHRLHAKQLVMRKLTAWEGPISVVDEKFEGYTVSPEFPTFTLDEARISPDYMRLVCQSPFFWELMKDSSTGTVQRRKRVSPSALLSLPINLPPVSDQYRIIDLMEAIDSYRSTIENVLECCQKLRQGLLSEIRSAGDPSSISELSTMVRRGKAPQYVDKPSTLAINQRCIRNGRVSLNDARFTEDTNNRLASELYLRDSDVLVNSTGRGTLGRVGLFVASGSPCTVDSHVTIVRPDPDSILPDFLGYALQAREAELESLGSGSTTQTELSRESISTLTINIPSPEDQQTHAALMQAVDANLISSEAVLNQADTFRSVVLAELLSGRAELPAAYDEVLAGVV